jgi:hypothetical protein
MARQTKQVAPITGNTAQADGRSDSRSSIPQQQRLQKDDLDAATE